MAITAQRKLELLGQTHAGINASSLSKSGGFAQAFTRDSNITDAERSELGVGGGHSFVNLAQGFQLSRHSARGTTRGRRNKAAFSAFLSTDPSLRSSFDTGTQSFQANKTLQATAQRLTGKELDRKIFKFKSGQGSRALPNITIDGITVSNTGEGRRELELKLLQKNLSPSDFAAFKGQQVEKNQGKITHLQKQLADLDAQGDPTASGQQNQRRLTQNRENRRNAIRSQLNRLTFGDAGLDVFNPEAAMRTIGNDIQAARVQARVGKSKRGGGVVTQAEADRELAVLSAQAQFESTGSEEDRLAQSAINKQRVAAGDISGRRAGTFATSEDALAAGQAAAQSADGQAPTGDAVGNVSELRNRGLSDSIIRSGLLRQGFTEAQADQALSDAPSVDLQAIRAAQVTEQAPQISDSLQLQLQSSDPAVVAAAQEQINLQSVVGAPTPSFGFDLFIPELEGQVGLMASEGAQQLFDNAANILGKDAAPFLDIMQSASEVGFDVAQQKMMSTIRRAQIEGGITRSQAQKMIDSVNNLKQIQMDDFKNSVKSFFTKMENNISDLERRGDADVADARLAQEAAIRQSTERLGRLGALNSTQAVQLVDGVRGEYDRLIERKKDEQFSQIRDLYQDATDFSQKALIIEREINQRFDDQLIKIEGDTNKQLFAIQGKIFDSIDAKNQAFADIYMNQANQVTGLMKDKRDLEQRIASENRAEQRQIRSEGRAFSRSLAKSAASGGSGARSGKPPTADQAKVGTFADRLAEAENIFAQLESEGFDAASFGSAFQKTELPFTNQRLVSGGLTGEDFKRQEQAERNFVNAVLRRESGAAIAESEFDSAAKQYFPKFGDGPEVLAQKAANRATVIRGFMNEAGPAAVNIRPVLSSAQMSLNSLMDNIVNQATSQQQGFDAPAFGDDNAFLDSLGL